jgi:hypothetical protein
MTNEQKYCMTKDSIVELQKIDCNCNNCWYMTRDFEEFEKWAVWNHSIQFSEFERKKNAMLLIPELKAKAHKLKFQFSKDKLLNYGFCNKFNKAISWIPDTCQIETQNCFVHRTEDVN